MGRKRKNFSFNVLKASTVIGKLTYDGNIWQFSYDKKYAEKKKAGTIRGFPIKDQTYSSRTLGLLNFFHRKIASSATEEEKKNLSDPELLIKYGILDYGEGFSIVQNNVSKPRAKKTKTKAPVHKNVPAKKDQSDAALDFSNL